MVEAAVVVVSSVETAVVSEETSVSDSVVTTVVSVSATVVAFVAAVVSASETVVASVTVVVSVSETVVASVVVSSEEIVVVVPEDSVEVLLLFGRYAPVSLTLEVSTESPALSFAHQICTCAFFCLIASAAIFLIISASVTSFLPLL